MVDVKKLVIPIVIAAIIGTTFAFVIRGPGEEEKELVFWHTYEFGPETEAIDYLLNEFRKQNPDMKIRVERQAFSEAPTKFILAAKAGKAPDVVRLQNDRIGEIAEMGYIEPLENYVDNALLNTYLDKTIEAMSWAGTLYGLPASYDFLALIYNKDMVPKPPEDTDELENIARTLKVGDKYGFVVPVKSSYWYFPWLYGFGGTIFAENGDPAINSPAAVRSAEWLVGLSKVHDLMPAVDADTMNTLFVQRRAAMIVQGPWFIVDAVRAGINVGITRLPKVSAENKWPAPLLGVKGYVIFSGSKQKENAFKLIKFLTSDTAGEVFASVAKTFPAMKAVHESPTIRGDPIFQSFLYQAEVGAPMPSDPLMGAVWTSLDTALQKIYMGTPAKQALDEAQAELTRGT